MLVLIIFREFLHDPRLKEQGESKMVPKHVE